MMFFAVLREWIAQSFLYREYFAKMPLPFSNIYFDTVAFVLILVYIAWRIVDTLRIARIHRKMQKLAGLSASESPQDSQDPAPYADGRSPDEGLSGTATGAPSDEDARLKEHHAQMEVYFSRMETILRYIRVYSADLPPEDIFVDAVVIGDAVHEITGNRTPPVSGADYPLLSMDIAAEGNVPAAPSNVKTSIANLSSLLPMIEETGDTESDFEKLMRSLEEAETRLAALDKDREAKEKRTRAYYEQMKKGHEI